MFIICNGHMALLPRELEPDNRAKQKLLIEGDGVPALVEAGIPYTEGALIRYTDRGTIVLRGCVSPSSEDSEAALNKQRDLLEGQLPSLLRTHQREAVVACSAHKRGIVKAPTGSGKSWIIGELTRRLPSPILITVPTRLLLHQMKRDIIEYWERVGVEGPNIALIGDGHMDSGSTGVTIAIPDSLHRDSLVEWLPTVRTLIADEVHTCANPTFYRVAAQLINREYSIGMSATPWTNGLDALLEGLFGPRIVDISEESMIEGGIIMKPIIRFYRAPGAYAPPALLKRPFSHWVYNLLYDHLIVKNVGRNNLIVRLVSEYVKEGNGPVVVLVNKVGTSSKKGKGLSHAVLLDELLQRQGISMPIIHGSTPAALRDKALRDLAEHSIPGIIAGPKLLSAGVSIKSIGYVVLAGAGSTDSTLIQRIGRALRVQEGKERPIIADFIDTCSYFVGQSQKRMAAVQAVYEGCVEVVQ